MLQIYCQLSRLLLLRLRAGIGRTENAVADVVVGDYGGGYRAAGAAGALAETVRVSELI